MKKPLVVFKFGSQVLTTRKKTLDEKVIEHLCLQISKFYPSHRIVIVSSGAVAAGQAYVTQRSSSILGKRASAGVGNIYLFSLYQDFFSKFNIPVAQGLLERHHFSNRKQFLNLRSIFETMWTNNLIPIINENDIISDYEIKFSDNDELAMLIATCFSAQTLFLGTSVNGVLDGNGRTIQKISTFDDNVYKWINNHPKAITSSIGLGGMLSKLNCAKLSCSLGTETVIFNAKHHNILLNYKKSKKVTICSARARSIDSKRRWIAVASTVGPGKIFIDHGALALLKQRKSLLIVGVKKLDGDFLKGDYIRIFSHTEAKDLGSARVRLSSSEIRKLIKEKNVHSKIIARPEEITIYH